MNLFSHILMALSMLLRDRYVIVGYGLQSLVRVEVNQMGILQSDEVVSFFWPSTNDADI